MQRDPLRRVPLHFRFHSFGLRVLALLPEITLGERFSVPHRIGRRVWLSWGGLRRYPGVAANELRDRTLHGIWFGAQFCYLMLLRLNLPVFLFHELMQPLDGC